jgi:hypothetical protein
MSRPSCRLGGWLDDGWLGGGSAAGTQQATANEDKHASPNAG